MDRIMSRIGLAKIGLGKIGMGIGGEIGLGVARLSAFARQFGTPRRRRIGKRIGMHFCFRESETLRVLHCLADLPGSNLDLGR